MVAALLKNYKSGAYDKLNYSDDFAQHLSIDVHAISYDQHVYVEGPTGSNSSIKTKRSPFPVNPIKSLDGKGLARLFERYYLFHIDSYRIGSGIQRIVGIGARPPIGKAVLANIAGRRLIEHVGH